MKARQVYTYVLVPGGPAGGDSPLTPGLIRRTVAGFVGNPIYPVTRQEEGRFELGSVPVGEVLSVREEDGQVLATCALDAYLNPAAFDLDPAYAWATKEDDPVPDRLLLMPAGALSGTRFVLWRPSPVVDGLHVAAPEPAQVAEEA